MIFFTKIFKNDLYGPYGLNSKPYIISSPSTVRIFIPLSFRP